MCAESRLMDGRKERREAKMSGFYREEPFGEGEPRPRAGKFRTRGRVCQVGTEGCWENLEARSALVCKICTSVPCIQGLKPNNSKFHVSI